MSQVHTKRIALITGANRGLGFEVSRQLAKKGISVILTSRDADAGRRAIEKLKSENLDVKYQQLDVTSPKSIDTVFQVLSQKEARLDILVNNAGVYLDHSGDHKGQEPSLLNADMNIIRQSLEINTLGAVQMIQKFAPLMCKNGYGRIVNVSSGMGQLSEMEGGWPGYRISKTALNAVTRIASVELQNSGILVNSVCPGWVKTDMGGPNAELTPEQGADTIVWLAMLPEGGPTGGFFRERKKMDW